MGFAMRAFRQARADKENQPMGERLGTLVGILLLGALMLFFLGAARDAGKPARRNRSNHANERDWLDRPGDDLGSGWTNFDYIAAEELEDQWGEGD